LSERWDVKKYFVTVKTVASAGASITVSPLVLHQGSLARSAFPDTDLVNFLEADFGLAS